MSKTYKLKLGVIALSVFVSLRVVADETEDRKKAAMATTKDFAKKLGGHMKAAMKEGGPTNAVKVCSDIAPPAHR